MKVAMCENDVTNETKVPYLVKHHIASQPDFIAFTHHTGEDVFAFAQRVKEVLKASGKCLFSPVLRIDVMQSQELELKVNEVESLDALTAFSGQRQPDGRRGTYLNELAIDAFRATFWENVSHCLIGEAIVRYF